MSKKLILVVVMFALQGCATYQKLRVDPQGRSKEETHFDNEQCRTFTNDMGAGIEFWDQCMENKGYTFQYIEDKPTK